MARRILALASLALLALAALTAPALTQAGGGCHGAVTPPGDGEASVIKIDGCMFFPTIARVPVGTTVRFLNTGDAPHNITGVVGSWASPLLEPGDEYRHGFAAPGVYPFACTLHPGMNGAIVVGADQEPIAVAAVTTQPPPVAQPGPDPMALAVAGLGGFAAGVVSGIGIALRRARPTG
jgi:plastocyanin